VELEVCSASIAALFLFHSALAVAEEPADDPPWAVSLQVGGYFDPSKGSAYLTPTLYADRDPLHFEIRYNYENFDTVSVFVGWPFQFGSTETFLHFSPMLGGAIGLSNGIAPGFELAAQWWRLSCWVEVEFLYDLDDPSTSSFYSWSGANFKIAPFLWVAGSMQQMKFVQDGHELEVGPGVGFSVGRVTLGFYYYFGIETSTQSALLNLNIILNQ
jgi:hypothetical protein